MKTKIKEPDWLTVSQAAGIKDISKQTLYQWVVKGKLTSKKSKLGKVLISNDETFKTIEATGNVRKRDLVMEYIRDLQNKVEKLSAKCYRQGTRIYTLEQKLKEPSSCKQSIQKDELQ